MALSQLRLIAAISVDSRDNVIPRFVEPSVPHDFADVSENTGARCGIFGDGLVKHPIRSQSGCVTSERRHVRSDAAI
jgi:hypothetical protein